MKRLVLLLALLSSAAQAETILMTCGTDSFRYSDGFLGLGTPKYEVRDVAESEWYPFCTPFQGTRPNSPDYVTTVTCTPRDKGITRHFESNHKAPETVEPPFRKSYSSLVTLDFFLLTRWDADSGRQQCSRLNRG